MYRLARTTKDKVKGFNFMKFTSWNEMDSSLDVKHEQGGKKFTITLKRDTGDVQALLEYEYIKPDVVDLFHTEVPPEFRGKGVAQLLAKSALDHFMKEDVKIKLTCTYLEHYVKKYPQPEYTRDKIINL